MLYLVILGAQVIVGMQLGGQVAFFGCAPSSEFLLFLLNEFDWGKVIYRPGPEVAYI